MPSHIKQDQSSYGLISELMTIATVTLVSPFVILAFVPMALMLLPVAAIAVPFVLVAFFGQTKAIRPVQPVAQLRPRLAAT